MKQQVIFITGATPKENYTSYYDYLREGVDFNPYETEFLNWNKTLGDKLSEEYEYLGSPSCREKYADYEAWKILFEKMLPFLHPEIILVTTSLGGSFILKYLGNNDGILHPKTGKKIIIKKLFLIAAAISDTPQEVMGSFAFDIEEVYSRVARWCEKIYIYHSMDDSVVPYEQSIRIKNYFPEAVFRDFHDRGHFYLEAEIPELVQDIKN